MSEELIQPIHVLWLFDKFAKLIDFSIRAKHCAPYTQTLVYFFIYIFVSVVHKIWGTDTVLIMC